jgi:XisI protein
MDYLEKYRELIEVTLDRCCQMNARHVEVDREIEVSDRLAFDRGRDQYLWFRFGWLGKQKIQCFVVYICIKNNKVWVEEDSTDLDVVGELLKAGVLEQDIVLGFHHPSKHRLTEFASV